MVMMDTEVDPILGPMSVILGDRRTFDGTESSLGFVPWTAQEEDIVCILLGCFVAVILQPSTTSSGSHSVGECYIHGLLEGELMQVVFREDG